MATLVCFHAHPDDEVISTGGTIARAAAEGHRVVLVVATNGEHGEVPDDLAPGETLVDRRRAETEASADGARYRPGRVARLHRLGHDRLGAERRSASFLPRRPRRGRPSASPTCCARSPPTSSPSTTGTATTATPTTSRCIASGRRRRRLVPDVRVLEATMNRDAFVQMIQAMRDAGGRGTRRTAESDDFDPHGPADDGNPMGMPEAELTLAVDVTEYLDGQACGDSLPSQPDHRHVVLPPDARRRVRAWRSAPSGSSSTTPGHPSGEAGSSSRPDREIPVSSATLDHDVQHESALGSWSGGVGLLVAACGGSDESASETTTEFTLLPDHRRRPPRRRRRRPRPRRPPPPPRPPRRRSSRPRPRWSTRRSLALVLSGDGIGTAGFGAEPDGRDRVSELLSRRADATTPAGSIR